jgi:hypothetical protein
MVDLIILLIGKCSFNAKFVATLPNFTKVGKEIILNNQKALFKSLLVLLLKAISVFSKDIMVKINLFFGTEREVKRLINFGNYNPRDEGN